MGGQMERLLAINDDDGEWFLLQLLIGLPSVGLCEIT
jgi:hypothetical protein